MATQSERREATISRLVAATIASLEQVGYAGTTVAAICERAQVSQGALFRHFPTRRALLAHAAEHVARRQVAAFRAHVTVDLSTEAGVRDMIATLVRLGASPENRTWHELMVAARTDSALRSELQGATDVYQREIMLAAADLAGDRLGLHLAPMMRVVLSFVDGLAVATPLTHDGPGIDAAVTTFARMLWLAADSQETPR